MDEQSKSSYLQTNEPVNIFANYETVGNGQLRSANTVDEQIDILKQDGVVCLHDIIDKEFLKTADKYISAKKYKGEKTNDVFVQDNINYIVFNKGQQDFWDLELKLPDLKPIENIIEKVIKTPYKLSSIGALTLDAKTKSTSKWHRDTMPLFTVGTAAENDEYTLRLPDFYFTVFIPTRDVIGGATEFSIMNHSARGFVHAGDAIIMNGKTLHRGRDNDSEVDRNMIYLIYCAAWYDEKKF